MAEAPTIEGFAIVRELGSGNMGTVYEADELATERKVAIKVLSSKVEGRALKRFTQEAQIGKLLDHPDIVRVTDYGQNDAASWIVMELIDGWELTYLLKDDSFPIDDRAHLLARVAAALHAAHERDIIHRDIKPSNIYATKDGGVRLLDFGIAKLEKRTLTMPGTIVGTPGYLSPEQSKGEAPGPRTDVFALGLVAYQTLTGGHYPWMAQDMMQLLALRASEPPRPFKEAFDRARFPLDEPAIERLHKIVHRAIEIEPDDRFDTALDFATALEAFTQRTGEVDQDGAAILPAIKADPTKWAAVPIDWAMKKGNPELQPELAREPYSGPWIVFMGLIVLAMLVVLVFAAWTQWFAD